MSLLQRGGVEVLVRALIDGAPPEDEIYLISQDEQIGRNSCGWQSRLTGHFHVPDGPIQKSWNHDLVCWLKVNKIDICHFHLAGTYDWNAASLSGCPITNAARAGIPTVTTNHQAVCFFDRYGLPKPSWRRWAGAAKFWPGKARQLQSVCWEASVSRYDLAVSRRYFPMFRSKLIQIYHSRLDADLPVSPQRSSKTILNVATVAFRKGQHLLVEAFALIAADFPDWQLRLVGFPAEKACIERIQTIIRANKLEDRVHLCGSDPDPTRYYEEAELYVQPSLIEGLGLSLQEAMFHGRACIGSTSGGIPELIADTTMGVLFPSGDVTALATALSEMMVDPAKRQRLGDAARASILSRGMTRQAMSTAYHTLYQQAVRPC